MRNLQLAKAAVAAGIRVLLQQRGIAPEQVDGVYLAGGFGSYLDPESAMAIGMLPRACAGKLHTLGNTALAGAAALALDPCAVAAHRRYFPGMQLSGAVRPRRLCRGLYQRSNLSAAITFHGGHNMEIRFPLILDGATGTELQKHGYAGDVSAEQWTLEHPDVIVDIQRGYVAAGSQVLYTPTFGANRQKLEERSIFNQTADYNRRLAALSRQAADGKAWIAGDLAPTGLFLAPLGEASFEDLVDIYTEQAAGLEAAGVDLYVIETMMTLSDARAAVLAVRSVSDKPIFVSFTCDESGRSLSGTDVTAALTVLQGMGISAFGLNCSTGPEQMLVQLRRLREYARVPLIAKPNAGMPITVGGKTVYDCTPEEFTAFVQPMLAAACSRFRRLLRHDGGAHCRAAHCAQGREIRPARTGAHRPAPGRNGEASLLSAGGRRARPGADRRARP